eukprot:CAMPEP_0113638758 /NCGR_PEP_ID=MMETSP0017_2-20120614/20316_1 /TAXON_ID=2856 /ORGANISM="Cylindrotheca closterium" /LENGTH=579 /DNA_ID=CAMNT_0000549905 /DNA_START=54 /DNA_END=1793 /DNA_ORIENTATION=- /assembly_acc=CAM_ASM_000147
MTSYHYFGNEGEAIPRDVEELVVHPLVQEIPEDACNRFELLTRVKFNGSALRTIGKCAFYECQALREIEIPPSVTVIGDHAFRDCLSLAKVHFHEDGLLVTIGRSAFTNCSSLIDISVPSSVEIIQAGAFGGCECLARVSFQEGLKVIGGDAFALCERLEKVDIPRTLEMVGPSAFSYCTSLQDVNAEEGNLRVIGEKAFVGCVNLQTISIPSTVEHLESKTFSYCDSLEVLKFQNGLKSVKDYVFFTCENLQAVALPESVEFIGRFAFGGCPKLVSVELGDDPRGVTIQDDETFSGCQSLVNICLRSADSQTTISNSDGVGVESFERCCRALQNQYGEKIAPLVLTRRFDNLPIHKKCYYASATTGDELAREIESSMQSSEDNDNTSDHFIDPFGMTPFHVLLSAANCRMDLLQILLDAYPPNVLGWKDDVNGKTAIEYLTQRSDMTEDARNMLRMALQQWLVGSISSWKGLEAWKSDMSSRVNAIVAADEVEQRQSLLQEASMVLSRYERMEATTVLELSLWKMELLKSANEAEDDDVARTTTVDKEDDRRAHRIRSGASVVIPHVIGFLLATTSTV